MRNKTFEIIFDGDGCEKGNVHALIVSFRYNEYMTGSDRENVQEGESMLIFKRYKRFLKTSYYFAESTILFDWPRWR